MALNDHMRRATFKVLYSLSGLVLVGCVASLYYFSSINGKDEYERSIYNNDTSKQSGMK